MTVYARLALVVTLLSLAVVLMGCPPGATGAAQQNMPPGVLPPPGLESGGARTLMGTTITPPDNSILLVSYRRADAPEEAPWRSSRRVILTDTSLVIEGINYDGRDSGDRDFNEVVRISDVAGFSWKYEAKPAPPEEPAEE